ncbi:RagB/SusD family nutrient uptake outer membrane protein [Niastella caeni]|uniref:RagB/SusD family nutrient uptake outer membrane protein n=1 Tax=Niastella caeni TaxID=2569763 RepID=A0A4S8HUP2_9BACT|nr:RagB/SusD family nutrient uptake outer membrane protein [Niastella caeni]THU39280.1 RagB/SusD family nutrient uptake outer membrane protein [Niastella caeni]
MHKIVTYTSFVLLLGTVTGCKKFLEKNPDNRASLESPEQVAQLLGTAYPQNNYMAFTESISDNVSDKGTGGLDLTALQPYFFKDVTENEQDSPEGYWSACYAAIAVANQALEACTSASDTAKYSSQKGEALVCRAYAHFMLVTLFAKTYNPNTAASDAGIPYVTTPEKVVFKNYSRKTVSYVYEMIEKDLVAGLPLLDDTRYTVPRYHFTKAAANAFASRFYLFKQDYTKALAYANAVFSTTNVSASLRPWNSTYLTLTYRELWARYAKASEPANLLLVETSSLWGRNYYNQRYGMDADKRTEILNSNVTGGQYAFTRQTYTAGTNNYMLPKVNEYFVRLSVNATIGYPYVMVPLFTTEEVLFNRIEANIYLNNIPAAVEDLNAYAATRIFNYNAASHTITTSKMQTYYGNSDPGIAALLTLLDFKRAEFVQEGMRWFDLLRYNIPVTHTTTEGQTMTLEADDKRRVFQIPESAKLSGLELNPR